MSTILSKLINNSLVNFLLIALGKKLKKIRPDFFYLSF